MFRFLVSASLRSRMIVLLVAVIVVGYGVTVQRSLPVDVFPDLNKGLVVIITEASGLAPEEVEVLVTTPIEAAVRGVTGMTRIRSISQTGMSVIYVEFDWGIDIYRARQVVTERLAVAAERLPPEMQPLLMPISSYMGEVLLVAMSGPKADPMVLRELADWVVAPRLQAIPGVSRVVPIGGLVRQYRVSPDLLKMNHLGVTFQDLESAIAKFGSNSGGGVVDQGTQEYLIRNMGRTNSLEDLRSVSVKLSNDQPVLLHQIAEVSFLPKQRRGDAGFQGQWAVILSIQKQPAADTLLLTKRVEEALRGLRGSMPEGVRPDLTVFRQADFINASVDNVQRVMIEAIVAVAIILFLFLANTRTTVISLVAIPLSVLMTFIVFRWTGMSLNTMTLGGLAIAVGELVDDAVVDVENIYRRLAENRKLALPRAVLTVIADASQEIRSGIVYSTMIIVLVFLPVFAIPGLEGQLFAPLGIAYIVSILASLLVSITVTPVLASFMLPQMSKLSGHQSWLILKLKNINGRLLNRVFDDPGPVLAVVGIAVFLAIAIVPTLPRAFLPPFNEGSLLVGMTLDPGISLEESARIGRTAELLLQQIPEVRTIGRRTGRSESDEHSLGVHETEFEIRIELADRRMETVMREVRGRLAGLPGNISVGQPISHRLIDHILTGTPGQLAVKIFGDDLDVLRNLAGDMNRRLSVIGGVVDLEIEKQLPVPQIQIRVDPRQARLYGVQPGPLTRRLAHMINGATVSQIVDGVRYFDVVIRLSDIGRDARSLAAMLIDTESGPIPLSHVAKVYMSNGPNQVLRENGRRRILITANGDGANDSRIAADVRKVVDEFPLPTGYFATFEGIYAEQTRSTLRLLGLAAISLSLIFAVLYTRYRSMTLAMIIMCNVPLSLIGCVLAVKLAGLQLSVASMIGFITLTGISTRNGILKISHYINLVLHENETFGREMILRGSQERLVPVLMTATSACFGLLPLLILPNEPGKEILYPVAVVIFGGLVVATFLDSLLTPLLFLRFGRSALERLASQVRAKPVIESF
jgi:HME family heavy-metal exporter